MKKAFCYLLLAFITEQAMAQRQQAPDGRMDTLFRNSPDLRLRRLTPVQPGAAIGLLPGATVIGKSNGGTLYRAMPDNMPVWVPDLHLTEKMPGSGSGQRMRPPEKMPNPLAPREKH